MAVVVDGHVIAFVGHVTPASLQSLHAETSWSLTTMISVLVHSNGCLYRNRSWAFISSISQQY